MTSLGRVSKPWIARDGRWLAAAILLAGLSAIVPAAAACGVVTLFIVLVWRNPDRALAIGAIAVLAVRPSLDAFSERRAGLGPFASNPAVLFGLVVIVLAIVLAVHRGRLGRALWPDSSIRNSHLWLLAAYGIASVSGALWYGSAGIGEAAREIARVTSVIAAFLLVVWWLEGRPKAIDLGWAALLAGLTVPLGVAAWQWASGTGNLETEGLNRLQGTLPHPNAFGAYLVPFTLVAVGSAARSKGMNRIAQMALAGTLTLILTLTYTRTAVIALVVGLAVLPLLQAQELDKRSLLRLGALAAVFAALSWLAVGPYIRERFTHLDLVGATLELARGGESENSFTWRIMNWGVLVSLGLQHPLVGHGAGMTTVLNPIVNQINGLPYNAHNDFVRFFFEGGSIGLACYGVYVLTLCLWAVRKARAAPPAEAPRAFGVTSALLALLLLTGGTPEISLDTAVLYELYGMLALLGASATRLRDGRTPDSRGQLREEVRI